MKYYDTLMKLQRSEPKLRSGVCKTGMLSTSHSLDDSYSEVEQSRKFPLHLALEKTTQL